MGSDLHDMFDFEKKKRDSQDSSIAQVQPDKDIRNRYTQKTDTNSQLSSIVAANASQFDSMRLFN